MVREAPSLIAHEIAEVRRRTSKAFGVNLIPFATEPKLLREELAVCLDAHIPAMCFFWDVYPDIVSQAKAAGCIVLHQVGSLDDALRAEAAGADVVILQGVEAGGHVRSQLPLSVLLAEAAGKLSIPVVASGGIADGRGLLAALALGADGIQCGTVFLASTESFAHDYHKQRIIAAKPGDTVHTDLFAINWPPDCPVRVLKNGVTDEADALWGHHPGQLPRVVIGDEEGRPLYKFGTDSPLRSTGGDLEKMALYAGEGAALVSAVRPAAEIIGSLMRDATETLQRISRQVSDI